MNENPTITTTEPLHVLLRRRREELGLFQAEIAKAVHVSPECITLWEAGRRRPELSKIPRVAEILELDVKEVCARALAEYHPAFYVALLQTAA